MPSLQNNDNIEDGLRRIESFIEDLRDDINDRLDSAENSIKKTRERMRASRLEIQSRDFLAKRAKKEASKLKETDLVKAEELELEIEQHHLRIKHEEASILKYKKFIRKAMAAMSKDLDLM